MRRNYTVQTPEERAQAAIQAQANAQAQAQAQANMQVELQTETQVRAPISEADEDAVWDALLSGQGSLVVAAEKLTIAGTPYTKDQLKEAIVDSKPLRARLEDYYKASTLVDLAEMLNLVKLEFGSRIGQVPAEDLGKLYSTLMERMLDMIEGRFKGAAPTTNVNVTVDAVLNSLPKEVREAVVIDLAQAPQVALPSSVSGPESDE